MKKTAVTFLLSICTLLLIGQTPNFSWAVDAGRAGSEVGTGVCKDIYGNVYVTGTFSSDTVYFGMIRCLRPAGVTSVVYTTKYDSLGNAVWVNLGSGTGTNEGMAITTDSSGNIYATGTYQNASITFGSTTLTNAGGVNYSRDIYLVKYNNSGTMIWARRYGGVNQDVPNAIGIDVTGNIIMSGIFASPTLVFGSTTLTNSSGSSPSDDSFVVKMDSSGNPLWAKMGNDYVSGYICTNGSYDVTSDPSGNIYITGNYSCTTTFSPVTLTGTPSGGGYNIYVTKYNSSGTVIWAKGFNSTNGIVSCTISADQNGNCYIGGYYSAPITFGSTTLALSGSYDAFFVKLNSSGVVQWAKKVGATGTEEIRKIKSDKYGFVTMVGTYSSALTIGTTGLTMTAGSGSGTNDIFIARYDSTGTVKWVKKAGGTNNDTPFDICIGADVVYLTGKYLGPSLIFGPPSITNYISGSNNMFLSKICTQPVQPSAITGPATSCAGVYCTYTVSPVAGVTSYAWTLPSGWTGSSITNTITVLTGSGAGTLSVVANSGCCSSIPRTLAVSITTVPATPGIVSGITDVCPGSTVSYSISAVTGATGYTWSLPAGWSGSSSTTSISVVAGTAGGNIQVNANNTCGPGSPRINPVTVSTSGLGTFPFSEGFQSAPFVPSGWTLYNPNADYAWVRSSAVGAYGTSGGSALFDNFTNALNGARDAIRTPKFDFTGCSAATLKFDVAYARYSASFIDSLNVYVSVNCGVTWTKIYGKGSTSLATAPDNASSLFVPTAVQWRTDSINVSAYSGQPNVMFSFENKSGYGQALYVDNVNVRVVYSTVGVSIAQSASAGAVCAGTLVTFTATPVSGGSAPAYQWKVNGVNTGVNSPVFSTSTLSNGDTVSCVLTSSLSGVLNNPATSNAIIVSVNPVFAPAVTANANISAVCAGNNVTLTGGGATLFTWSGGITDGVSFVPSATTTYFVTGVDNSTGCQNSASATINVLPLPVVSAFATSTIICEGSSLTLSGSGAHLYAWSGGITNAVPFNASSTTTFTVTGTDTITGCQGAATKTIVVNPRPLVSANATDSVVCAGESVILSGSGANTYTWSGGVSNNVSFIPGASLTYTVTGTITSSGCQNTNTKTIIVNPLPSVSISATASVVCYGDSVKLTASGADSYSWTGGIINNIAFVPSNSSTYTVTATITSTGCQKTAVQTVTVNPLPVVTANSSANEICSGGSVTLNGGGAISYVWNNGVSNGVAFNPSATQVYSVIGTNSNGCTNIAAKTVIVNTPPVPAICNPVYFQNYISPLSQFRIDTANSLSGNIWISNGPSVGNQTCVNQLHLNESSTYYFFLYVSGSSCGKVALWIDYNNNGTFSDEEYLNSSPPAYPIYSICYSGYYAFGPTLIYTVPPIAVRNTALRMRVMTYDNSYDGLITDGCTSSIHGRYYDYTVFIGPPLPAVAGFTPGVNNVCAGSSVHFSNTSSHASTYLWDFGDGTTSTSTSPNHVYSSAGIYDVKLIASNSSGADTLIISNCVSVTQSPVANIVSNGPTSLCAGDSLVLLSTGTGNVLWLTGDTGSSIVVNNAGTYSLTSTNSCGSDTTSINISIIPSPSPPVITQSGNSLSSNYIYGNEWYLDGTLSDTSQSHFLNQNGTYSVVAAINGCLSDTSSVIILASSVWPGDANNDSLVTNADLLPIGIHYSQVGLARATISNSWQAWFNSDWGTAQSNNADIKHADCNGDGVINENDTLAVNLNFSSVHAFVGHNDPDRVGDPMLYFTSSSQTYLPGDWIDIDIIAGNNFTSVSNLYGIAFTLNYDASLVQAGTENLFYPMSWFGLPGTDAIKFSHIEPSMNSASGAETRIDHTSRDGYGKIATFRFQAKATITAASAINFSISSCSANDSAGNQLLFNDSSYIVVIDPMATSINEDISHSNINIFPNPYAGYTTISYTLKERAQVGIVVTNSLGQNIQTLTNQNESQGNHSYSFSAKSLGLGAGIYFVKITINGLTTMKRVVETK